MVKSQVKINVSLMQSWPELNGDCSDSEGSHVECARLGERYTIQYYQVFRLQFTSMRTWLGGMSHNG